jgi:hypothetical protein
VSIIALIDVLVQILGSWYLILSHERRSMTDRTKLIGIVFLLFLFIGAIIVDLLNWPNLIHGIPAIGLEIAFFVSVFADAISEKSHSF